jgi:hypothetical protein
MTSLADHEIDKGIGTGKLLPQGTYSLDGKWMGQESKELILVA